MSSFRNNGARPPKRPATEAPEGEAPKAKKTKVIDLESDETLEFEEEAPKAPPAAPKVPPTPATPKVWKPYMPQVAAANYRYHPANPSVEEIEEQQESSWFYSPSLKGYVRVRCAFCDKGLSPDEYIACASYRNQLPFAPGAIQLQPGSTGQPPVAYKIRTIQTCDACAHRIVDHLDRDPQCYNGRGRTYWVFPHN